MPVRFKMIQFVRQFTSQLEPAKETVHGAFPVSYTHLDVYKRQQKGCVGLRVPLPILQRLALLCRQLIQCADHQQ